MKEKIIVPFIVFLIVIADYFTKKAIVTRLMLFDSIDVFPFLRIVHVENRGAAFGLFAGLGNNFFMAVSLLVIVIILIYGLRFARGIDVYALSLIVGGAIGNLIDRFRIGKVIDFIDLYIGNWHWPAFNVADSALTIGIGLFILSSLLSGKHKKVS